MRMIKKHELVFEEDLTIKTAPQLKEALVNALIEYEHISIIVKSPSAIDLTAMQLLMGAERHAKAMDKKLDIQFDLPEEAADMLEKAGFGGYIKNS